MNKYIILLVFSLILASCGKKEIEKKTIKEMVPFGKKSNKVLTEEVEEVKKVPEIVFTVQIAALKNENSVLENIDGVQVFEENNLTKFRLGQFETYQEAKSFRTSNYKKYPDAFIQALKDNTPINIKEALK